MKQSSSSKHKTDQVLKFYVDIKDYQNIMAEYQVSGLYSISAYLRKKVIGNGIIIPDATDLKNKLDKIGYQYARIGNNINQIAKKVHLYQKNGAFPMDILDKYNELMQQHLKVTEELSRSFRAFLRELARK